MADVTKNIVIQVDAKGATVTVNGVAKSFDTLTRAVKFAKDEMKDVNTGLEQMRNASGLAGAATLELGRIIQDSNYGIQGIANNVTQLSSLLVSLTITAGGVTNAFKAMWKALTGPLGIILAISGVVAAMERMAKSSEKAKEAIKDLSVEMLLLSVNTREALSAMLEADPDNIWQRAGVGVKKSASEIRKELSEINRQSKEGVLGFYKEFTDLKNAIDDQRKKDVPNVEAIIKSRETLIDKEIRLLEIRKEVAKDFGQQTQLEAKIYEKQQERARVRNEEELKYADILKERPKNLEKVEDLVSSKYNDMRSGFDHLVNWQINKEAELTLRTEEEIRRRYRAYQQMFSSLSQLNQDFASLAELNAQIELQNAIKRGEDEETARLRIEKKKQAALVKAAKFQAALDAAMLGAQIARDFAQGLVSLQVGAANTAKIGFPQNIPFLVAYAAQVASIIISMRRAKKQAEASIGAIGGGDSGGGGSNNIVQPSFNIVGASGTNQLADTIRSQTDRPVKAYVVSKDVRSAAELERNIIDGSSMS